MIRRRLSTRARARIFASCEERCHVCGGAIQPGQAWDLDHVIPLALGGADDETNLAPIHSKTCHRTKTTEDVGRIRKADRQRAFHLGLKPKSSRPLRHPTLKRKFNGRVIAR